jgi:fructose-1-phosphate kinase PfkB-like protein
LRQGLAARPYAIKPNSEEAGEALGRPVVSDDEHAAALDWFQDNGSGLVCVTRGARGIVLALNGARLSAAAPPIAAASPIGAGDATLAGLVWAVTDGCDPVETARRAVACGTAAAMQEGTGVGDRASVEMLLGKIDVISFSE